MLPVNQEVSQTLEGPRLVLQGLPGGSVVKNPPANAGDVGLISGSERSLEKEKATHSSILAREILMTEESDGL